MKDFELNDPNTTIHYGLRKNDLGEIMVLGKFEEKYLCIVTDDGVSLCRWLDHDQIQNVKEE